MFTEQKEGQDAGMSMDLDSLLGLDGSDIGGNVDNVDLSSYGEPEEKIEYPHFKVSTKKFMEVLRISNIVSQSSNKDTVAKAIGMEVKGGELQTYLSDFDVFVEKSIEVLNTENVLTDYIVVNLAIIAKLIKACSNVLVIYKKDEKYYLKLIGGDMELETIKVEKEQIRLKDRAKFQKEGTLNKSEFYKTVKDLFVLANAGVTPAQRRIFFNGKDAYSIFLYCIARHTSSNTVPSMDVKIKDSKILYSLATGCDDNELTVQKHGNRICITGSNFMYSFMLSDNNIPQQMIDSMDKIFKNELVFVDYNQLVKITDVSTDLMYSLSRLDFNYLDGGQVETILRTKRTDSTFTLKGTANPKVVRKANYVSVQSSLLKVLLKVFSQESTIGLVIDDIGIGIKSDNYTAVLFTEGE